MKKLLLGFSLALVLILIPSYAFAADSSGCTAPETLGGPDYCPPATPDYWGGACHARVICTAPATFNCSSGACVCPACGAYPTCTAAPSNDCAGKNRVVGGTTCNPVCGACLPNFIDLTPLTTDDACTGACPDGSLRTSAGCVPMEPVASLLAPVFGKTLADLVTISPDIISGIVGNIAKSYYFLAPNDNPPLGAVTIPPTKYYEYGTGGGAIGAQVRLEADWADEAWLAQNLNWDNIPTNIANLFQNLAGVTFCDTNADCTPGTCDNGICRGSVALGGACNDTNLFCVSPLVCDSGICKTASNQVSPSDITPGTNGQVLTTVAGVTSWAAAAGGLGQFVGLTSTSFSVVASYETVNGYCKTGSVVAPTNGTTGTTTSVVGAHVCDASEMTNSYNNANAAIGYMATNTAMADTALINNGPPGYLSFSNDCLGWKEPDGDFDGKKVYGAVWNFPDKSGRLSWCADIVTASLKFACCK